MTEPPTRSQESQIAVLLGLYSTVVEPRTAIYVSAPITTGGRFLAWLAGGGLNNVGSPATDGGLQESVITPNVLAAREVVTRVRKDFAGTPVIDPTALPNIDDWTQDTYREFWGRVIERYVRQVVFVEGWEHSDGCCYEYLTARRCGVDTLDDRYRDLPVAKAARLIQMAIQARATAFIDSGLLEETYEQLTVLPNSE